VPALENLSGAGGGGILPDGRESPLSGEGCNHFPGTVLWGRWKTKKKGGVTDIKGNDPNKGGKKGGRMGKPILLTFLDHLKSVFNIKKTHMKKKG